MTLQAEHIKQHSHYEWHKVAERAFYRPDMPLRLPLQNMRTDELLLTGAVPQPADWLRAWHASRTPQSWKVAAASADTEHYIARIRGRAVQSRGLRAMAEIIREVVRRQKRQWLRVCSSIALSFDDRKGYKLVRFRCDVPFDAPFAATQGEPWKEGIIGCFDCLRGTTLSELAEDYAVRTSAQVLKLVQAFGADDDELYRKFLAAVKIVVADGALQKVAHVMKTSSMPGIVLITRDPAHMIRIACKEPLIRTGRFERQHKRLFEDRHALIKDIQYSDLWQARLEECQRLVVRTDGSQGGGVKHIMRHLSYAPQRFESWADPRRKYACCLNAIALMLADIASDARLPTPQRERAEACLDAMTPQDILEAGIAADFGEISMRLRVILHNVAPTPTYLR